ncbi:ribonuclease III [Trametes coccinea BRFM310]|uniref:Ribonuclease III n=1 Tax=Trametes coccinea (strain BRFM310) TaxID=1353009 RepID=A0A1Y2IQ09_TRAC3|nr:ribonuclease III [Trametes coccinea BRFM310]
MASYYTLQQSIREAISRPDFDAALPPLSDQTWMRILTFTPQAHAENERLEFLGDALMYATIGRQLYTQVPNGSPHLYTCVRAALHSNMTFAMLAEKLDIMAVSSTVLKALTRKTFGEGTAAPHKSRPQIKATADLFETVIGAYYLDHGFDALCKWVEEIYRPLIRATVDAFHQARSRPPPRRQYQDPRTFSMDWRSEAKTLAPAPSKSKLLLSPVQRRKRAIQKIKAAHAARPSRRSPSLKIRVMGSPNLPKVVPPLLGPKAPSGKLAIEAAPLAKKQTPVIIDLTVDSDSDSDNEPPFFRHPLVTPRIPRTSAATVSKRATPAPAAVPAADTREDSDSEWEDETMLENMLTAQDAFSESDMDCGSSDVESPGGPSNLAPFLTRPGLVGHPLDIGTPPNVRAVRRLYG